VGNLTSKVDFNGKTTTYAYDSLNRLLSKTPDTSFTGAAAIVMMKWTPFFRHLAKVKADSAKGGEVNAKKAKRTQCHLQSEGGASSH